jgi:hypothetical protein
MSSVLLLHTALLPSNGCRFPVALALISQQRLCHESANPLNYVNNIATCMSVYKQGLDW